MLAEWVDAGQPASTFDDQTPRTHAAIMEGCRRRELRAAQRDIAVAWHGANFARAGKNFKDLDHYLEKLTPKPAQTADEVVGIFEGFAKRGKARVRVVPHKKEGSDGG